MTVARIPIRTTVPVHKVRMMQESVLVMGAAEAVAAMQAANRPVQPMFVVKTAVAPFARLVGCYPLPMAPVARFQGVRTHRRP